MPLGASRRVKIKHGINELRGFVLWILPLDSWILLSFKEVMACKKRNWRQVAPEGRKQTERG
jgi:hypothetical protein